MNRRCECPETGTGDAPEWMYSKEELIGRVHKPNKCKCVVELKLYKRNNKKLWLCSYCFMPGDVEVFE